MKIYFSIFVFIFLVGVQKIFCSNPEWITYSFGGQIFTMVNDGDFLWLGTDGGLVKFNKLTGEKLFYNKANTNNGLTDNHIRSLALDSQKTLWVGTEYGGVSKFDGAVWQNFNPGNSPLPYEYISCIAVDRNDKVFIGNGDFLSIFDGTTWTSYELGNPVLSFFTFNNIVFNSRNTAFISTTLSGPGAVFTFHNNEISRIENDSTNFINSMIIDDYDNIWCGSSKMGLLKFNGKHFDVYDTTNSDIPSNNVRVSSTDDFGNLWLTANNSVWKYDKENWIEYKPGIPIPPDNIFEHACLIYDQSGILWIGTRGTGLLKYFENKWENIKTGNSGLINNFINLVASDEEGKIWITFMQPRDSVLCFDGTAWSFHKKEDFNFWNSNFRLACNNDTVQIWQGKGILIEFIQTEYNWVGVYNVKNYRHGNHIKLDKNENVWQVSSKKGLWKYDHHAWTYFNYENTPIDFKETNAIAFDEDGILYALSGKGIIKYDGINWVLYPKSFFISDTLRHGISCLEIDRTGNIWLGTRNRVVSDSDYGEGLIKFDGLNITRYDNNNSLIPNTPILDLHFDSKDNLWIGTELSGLIKFDCKNTWTIYNSENSAIFSRFDINPLEIDIHDNIWFGMWWSGLGVFNEEGIVTYINKNFPEPLPYAFNLYQNYPNPFNSVTKIKYTIPVETTQQFIPTSLRIYDILGREVSIIVKEDKSAGSFEVEFNAPNLSSGVYFYRLQAGNLSETKKLILQK